MYPSSRQIMQSENVSGSFATAAGTSVYIPSIKYEHHFYYLQYIHIYKRCFIEWRIGVNILLALIFASST